MPEKNFLGFSVIDLIKNRKNINQSKKNNTDESIKNKLGDAANHWIAKNRSLTLRQTPFWAQSITALLICLGSISLVASIFFRIEEVISATGQLKSIGGLLMSRPRWRSNRRSFRRWSSCQKRSAFSKV